MASEGCEGDEEEEAGVEGFFEVRTGRELVEMVFGVVGELGAMAHRISDVGMEFLELSRCSLDVHCLLPSPLVHFVSGNGMLLLQLRLVAAQNEGHQTYHSVASVLK